MTQDRRDTVARAIYMTHWKAPDPETGRAGAPVWENVSGNVSEWVSAQADSAIGALEGMDDALDKLIKDNAWRQSMNTMGSGDSPSPQQPRGTPQYGHRSDVGVDHNQGLGRYDQNGSPQQPTQEDEWFAFLCQKYVQRADDRQKEMGLQYTDAETRDLAKECDRFAAQRVTAAASEAIALRHALEAIANECDPADHEWDNPAEGRRYCWDVTQRALSSTPQNPGDAAPHQEGEE